MRQLIFSIFCLIFTAAIAAAQSPQIVQQGFSIERDFDKADKHVYEVSLTKGQMLNFVVE